MSARKADRYKWTSEPMPPCWTTAMTTRTKWCGAQPDKKTLTVTVDGISSEVSTYVNPPLDATFTLPGITLAHTKTNFEISDDIFMANRSVSFTVKSQDDDDFYTPGHYGISFERKENTKEVRATFTHTGHYTVRMTVEDDGCGNIYQERTIDVLEGMEAPQIALVTVDP